MFVTIAVSNVARLVSGELGSQIFQADVLHGLLYAKKAIETPFSTKLEKSKAACHHATQTTVSLMLYLYISML